MDGLWFAITAVAAVALGVVAVRTFLLQIGGKDVFLGRPRLEISETDGFVDGEYEVGIAAEVRNTGGGKVRGQVVEALVDGEVVATSEPVDLGAGQSGHVRLSIPRRFVTGLDGDRPLYRGEFALRVARG